MPKHNRPARNPLSRLKPIRQPHTLLHQCDSWALHHIHGAPWPWYQLRYSRRQPCPTGRNAYWLAWNVEDRRFARSSDLAHFERHNPHIVAWIARWLEANPPPATSGTPADKW